MPKVTAKDLKIATRGSQLALWQANYVKEKLEAMGYRIELDIIKTSGDRVQDRFLHSMGGKGLFVRELEQAMLDKKVDLAVHSLKDLPAITPKPFCLPAILKRHRPNDAMIFSEKSAKRLGITTPRTLNAQDLKKLGPITVATASLRRQSILKGLSQDITMVAVRGNVDTRIKKLEQHNWDALILAEASLERLQLDHLPYASLDIDWFVPCAAQGALAIECLNDHPARADLERLKDDSTMAAATLERAVLAELGGDCTMPFGSYATDKKKEIGSRISTIVADYQGNISRYVHEFDTPLTEIVQERALAAVLEGLRKNELNQRLDALQREKPDLGPLF